MTKHDTTPRNARSDRAIVSVLAAEERARESIASCAREADAIISGAQQRAQALAERTDRRITRLRVHCDRAIRERTAALFEADAAQAERVAEHNPDTVSVIAAATRVATALTVRLDENPPGPSP